MSREQRQKTKAQFASRETIQQFRRVPLRLPESSVRLVLHELCVTLGYCLPATEQEKIVAAPPTNPELFAKVVIEAEGLNPGDLGGFSPVLDLVAKAFVRELEVASASSQLLPDAVELSGLS